MLCDFPFFLILILLDIQFPLAAFLSCLQYFLIFSKFLFFFVFFFQSNGEYSNVACSTTPGLYPKSSPAKYSYFSNSPDHSAEILAACLSKLY